MNRNEIRHRLISVFLQADGPLEGAEVLARAGLAEKDVAAVLAELNDLPDNLTERRQGFSRRLRAIGHLFEAEDESQEWPELHNAIREARKAYQADGTMPDWEALAVPASAVAGT